MRNGGASANVLMEASSSIPALSVHAACSVRAMASCLVTTRKSCRVACTLASPFICLSSPGHGTRRWQQGACEASCPVLDDKHAAA